MLQVTIASEHEHADVVGESLHIFLRGADDELAYTLHFSPSGLRVFHEGERILTHEK